MIEEKEKLEKEKREKERAEKQRQEQQERERLEKERKAQEQRVLAAERKAEAARRAEAERKAEVARRAQALRRMSALAGGSEGSASARAGTGGRNPGGADARDAGPSGSYAARVRARVRPNIVFGEDIPGNPAADVEVRTDADGNITSARLIKSSGNPAWDRAVIRALEKTGSLPRDLDGRIHPHVVISFRPRD